MPMGKGTYGSQMGRPPKKKKATPRKPTGQLKLNMQKMPPEVQKKLMDAMKKKKKSSKGPDLKYNPYGTGTGSRMNPTRASRTTGP